VVVGPAVITPTPALPVVLPPGVKPPVTQATDWRAAIVGALGTVAREITNSQFHAWTLDPLDIFALVASESGGSWTAAKDEGFSSKMGRNFWSFGLFQMNELFGQDRYRNAAALVGPNIAKVMPPFPLTQTWTKDQARIPLTTIPGQIWYGMALLRSFSLLKNTNFDRLDATAVATTSPSKQASESIRATAATAASRFNKTAAALGIPASAVALKSFWLASSLPGMSAIAAKSPTDIRLVRFAEHWKAEKKRLGR
jgi:hypothetical protein